MVYDSGVGKLGWLGRLGKTRGCGEEGGEQDKVLYVSQWIRTSVYYIHSMYIVESAQLAENGNIQVQSSMCCTLGGQVDGEAENWQLRM